MTLTGDTISWTPDCDDIDLNDHSVTVRATDNGSPALYTEQTFDITVIVATDTDCWPDITYTLEDGPLGMTLTGDTISWTPDCDDSGINSVTVRATDNGSPALYTEQTFTITVEECEPCFLSSLSLRDGHTPKEYLPLFDSGNYSYSVDVIQNVGRMYFTAESSCIIKYKFARGNCGGHVTTWTDIDVPQQWLNICNNGDNVLEIRVSGADGSRENIYTITIVPRDNLD